MKRRKPEIEFTDDSVKKRLNEINNHLDLLINNAHRDYKRIVDKMNDDSDIIQLENARNNAQKNLEQYFKLQLDLMKQHIAYATVLNNNKNNIKAIEADNKQIEILEEDVKLKIQEQIKQMKQIKKST
jgi:hypothetical protein